LLMGDGGYFLDAMVVSALSLSFFFLLRLLFGARVASSSSFRKPPGHDDRSRSRQANRIDIDGGMDVCVNLKYESSALPAVAPPPAKTSIESNLNRLAEAD
jgi:hypothetical protein